MQHGHGLGHFNKENDMNEEELHSEGELKTMAVCFVLGILAGLFKMHGLSIFFGLIIVQCTLESGFKALMDK